MTPINMAGNNSMNNRRALSHPGRITSIGYRQSSVTISNPPTKFTGGSTPDGTNCPSTKARLENNNAKNIHTKLRVSRYRSPSHRRIHRIKAHKANTHEALPNTNCISAIFRLLLSPVVKVLIHSSSFSSFSKQR